MANIGENIRKLRELRGMSQSQLAGRIEKTRSAVSQYESGKIVPRMGVIEDMADVFGVNKNAIIGDHVNYAIVSFDGDMEDEEAELLDLFRKMNGRQRAALTETARAMVG